MTLLMLLSTTRLNKAILQRDRCLTTLWLLGGLAGDFFLLLSTSQEVKKRPVLAEKHTSHKTPSMYGKLRRLPCLTVH